MISRIFKVARIISYCCSISFNVLVILLLNLDFFWKPNSKRQEVYTSQLQKSNSRWYCFSQIIWFFNMTSLILDNLVLCCHVDVFLGVLCTFDLLFLLFGKSITGWLLLHFVLLIKLLLGSSLWSTSMMFQGMSNCADRTLQARHGL